MKFLRSLPIVFPAALLIAAFAQNRTGERINLPTSKYLTSPSPGRLGSTNTFPATIAISPKGRYAALLNNGYGSQETQAHQSISILDLRTNQIADFPDDRLGDDAHQSYFLGLAFSSDGQSLYASMGSITDPVGSKPRNTGNGIAVYSFRDGKVVPSRFIKIPPQKAAPEKWVLQGLFKLPKGSVIPYPAGIAVIPHNGGDSLLVANNLSDNVVLLDVATGQIVKHFDLSIADVVPSAFPYTVVASRDGRRAWCSLWNASRVAELDLQNGNVVRWIPLEPPSGPTAPGSHPTAMLLTPDEKLLFVALANADKIVAFDTSSGKVRRSAWTTPNERDRGTSPSALALSGDGARLFVADSSLNSVAVINAAHLSEEGPPEYPLGLIPTDWYPTAVAVQGDDLLIATGKGVGAGPNNGISALKSERRRREHPYLPTLMAGSIARLSLHKLEVDLPKLTKQTEAQNLFDIDPGSFSFTGGVNPIKHVIYIIKENRTFDQVLGDLKVGDGDSSLTLYGQDITPNEHKLALQFGVLDNFYDSGEVSGDGHDWSTAAITTDYNEKTWQVAYRGKERTYDYQGTVADDYPLQHNVPDVDDPQTGFLWDNLVRHGVTFRDYGEFIFGEWCTPRKKKSASPREGTPHPAAHPCGRDVVRKGEPLPANVGQPHGSTSPWPWDVPLVMRMVPTKPDLRDHFDPLYPDFNTQYPDQLRVDEFLNEFNRMVRARTGKTGSELPGFVLLYLPNDHTAGKQPNAPTPVAAVADNDLALGRVVEAVSHSPYWDDTAIFVLEDDAQDGADHVDAHRSIAFVISKYSPGSSDHPYIAHQFYTTVNMVHTMEALLGLPPMNQNDAHAPIMAPLFSGPGDQKMYDADSRNLQNGLIYQMNPRRGSGAEESSKMDFSRPDAANAAQLNAILWRDRKGNVPMPPPRHAVLPSKGAGK